MEISVTASARWRGGPNSLVDFHTGRHVFVDLGLAEEASEVVPGRPDAYLGHLGLAVIFRVEVVSLL